MKKIEFSAIENEMANFNFNQLQADHSAAKDNLKLAASAADISSEICKVWSKIRRFVILAENIPFIGKFITILADLLDSICGVD